MTTTTTVVARILKAVSRRLSVLVGQFRKNGLGIALRTPTHILGQVITDVYPHGIGAANLWHRLAFGGFIFVTSAHLLGRC